MNIETLGETENFVTILSTSINTDREKTVLEVAVDPMGRRAILFNDTTWPGVGHFRNDWMGSFEELLEVLEASTPNLANEENLIALQFKNGTSNVFDNEMSIHDPEQNKGPQSQPVILHIPVAWGEILKRLASEGGLKNFVFVPHNTVFFPAGFVNGWAAMLVITDSFVVIEPRNSGSGFWMADGKLTPFRARWTHNNLAPILASAIEHNKLVVEIAVGVERTLSIPIDLARKIYKLIS